MDPGGNGRTILIEAFEVAGFTHPAGSPAAGRRGIVMAYAVVHPAGVLLFDTGIGIGDPEIYEAYHATVRDLPALMCERGLAPERVVALAVSGEAGAWDRSAYRSSVARLRALQPDVVLFGHDR